MKAVLIKYLLELITMTLICIGVYLVYIGNKEPLLHHNYQSQIDSTTKVKDSLIIHEKTITTQITINKIYYDSQKVLINYISNDSNNKLLLANIARFESGKDIK